MKIEEELLYRYKSQIAVINKYLTVQTSMLLFKHDTAYIIDTDTLKLVYRKNGGIYFLEKVPELKKWNYWYGFLYHPVDKRILKLIIYIDKTMYSVTWDYEIMSFLEKIYVTLFQLAASIPEYFEFNKIHGTILTEYVEPSALKFKKIDLQEELHLTTIDLNHIILTYYERWGEISTFIKRFLDPLKPRNSTRRTPGFRQKTSIKQRKQ